MYIGIILLLVVGVNSAPIYFCLYPYCYSSDGALHKVTDLTEAQNYCTMNDSNSWLLELYDKDSFYELDNHIATPAGTSIGPVLVNTMGTSASQWTSVLGSPIPSGFSVDQTTGSDLLYLSKSGSSLTLHGTDNTATADYICQFPGNCSNGYCYEVRIARSWFSAELDCIANPGTHPPGHLFTFEGMTMSDIANMPFVQSLPDNTNYWVGYSKVIYDWRHSNTRAYTVQFQTGSTSFNSATPNNSYFVYLKNEFFSTSWGEKPVGSQDFILFCMTSIETTTTELTSFATTTLLKTDPTSASIPSTVTTSTNSSVDILTLLTMVLPSAIWTVFALILSCCVFPVLINRNRRRQSQGLRRPCQPDKVNVFVDNALYDYEKMTSTNAI